MRGKVARSLQSTKNLLFFQRRRSNQFSGELLEMLTYLDRELH